MHLLETSTLVLHSFFDPDIPHYAILSHTWGEDEVLFQHIRDGIAETKLGYRKVQECCRLALSEGWDYVWIDSCCIDKTSSAELSEAINSMFRWYEDAQVCYAYLSDVPKDFMDYGNVSIKDAYKTAFRESNWFTRGWTLQELLAPSTVVFYDKHWEEIGTRTSLESSIRSITSIDRALTDFKKASVAQKMSWAALRQTTRTEDIAYSLMGLFGVNMTTIYGEGGTNAFIRLQLKIISKTHDESIFAWTENAVSSAVTETVERGLLAASPAEFLKSGNIRQRHHSDKLPSYSITNRGLRMEQQILIPGEQLNIYPTYRSGIYVAVLNCSSDSSDDCLGIYLRRQNADDDFLRIRVDELISFNRTVWRDLRPQVCVAYVKQLHVVPRATPFHHVLRVDMTSAQRHGYQRPSYEASDPLELSLPTNSFYDQLIAYTAPSTDPTWIMYKLHDRSLNDTFEVVVYRQDKNLGVNIFVAPMAFSRTQKTVTGDLSWLKSPWSHHLSDRASQILRSGRSVSVTLKNGREAGRQRYLVTISIDPDGNLPWPVTEPATTVPSTTVPSTTVPSTTVPSTTVPSTTVPPTTVPSKAGSKVDTEDETEIVAKSETEMVDESELESEGPLVSRPKQLSRSNSRATWPIPPPSGDASSLLSPHSQSLHPLLARRLHPPFAQQASPSSLWPSDSSL